MILILSLKRLTLATKHIKEAPKRMYYPQTMKNILKVVKGTKKDKIDQCELLVMPFRLTNALANTEKIFIGIFLMTS